MSVLKIDYSKYNFIDVKALKSDNRKLAAGLIAPSSEDVPVTIAPDHAADPIKSLDDINRISKYLISEGKYRDNMLFIVGINFGLRASDLRMLRFSNLITPEFVFKESFAVFEQKTRNTRKRKKNRYITINRAVMDAVTLFLENTPNVSLSDYMFRSHSNNSKSVNEPITVRAIEGILKTVAREVGINAKVSTHTLRKTFCYHQMVMSHNDTRKLLLLQKMLNHSSPAQTLDYIGITTEEIEEAYKQLNLGSEDYDYLAGCNILEKDAEAV